MDAKLGPKGATAATTAPKGLSRMSPKCSKKPPWVEKCRSRPANRYCPSLRKKTNPDLSSAGHLPPLPDSPISLEVSKMVHLQQIYIKIKYLGCLQADLMGGSPGEQMPPQEVSQDSSFLNPRTVPRYHLVRSVVRIYGMGAWRGSENLCENLCYGGLEGR